MKCCIVGAGPVGLYAAWRLRGAYDVEILERGQIGCNVDSWNWVTLFSDNSLNVPKDVPIDVEGSYLTGKEFLERYLEPLAELLKSENVQIRTGCKVLRISRGRKRKMKRGGRFAVVVVEDEEERVQDYDLVVDCSGTYGNGIPLCVPGESRAENEKFLTRIIPEKTGNLSVVIGSGYSAITTLKQILIDENKPEVIWVTDKVDFHVEEDDPLPQRKSLLEFANTLKHNQRVIVKNRVDLQHEKENGVDHVYSLIGYKPDQSVYDELQVHSCYATDGPIKLAATLIGGGGDCMTQPAPGEATLENPEPDFYILGMKSYGRNSTFLMRVGYEQVDTLCKKLNV